MGNVPFDRSGLGTFGDHCKAVNQPLVMAKARDDNDDDDDYNRCIVY